jgi:hypothetical protein
MNVLKAIPKLSKLGESCLSDPKSEILNWT